MRGAGFAVLALYMCAFAASAVLPYLAATKASEAAVAAASASPSALRHAEDTAKQVTRLDPFSDAGLKVQATIAIRRGELRRAQADLIQATGRDPTDGAAWQQLAVVEFGLRDSQGALEAVNRALALDPQGLEARVFAASAVQSLGGTVPPDRSATATAAQ